MQAAQRGEARAVRPKTATAMEGKLSPLLALSTPADRFDSSFCLTLGREGGAWGHVRCTIRQAVARCGGPGHHALEDGRVQYDLCPRACHLKEGQRGFCYVRRAEAGSVVLDSYGRASGFCSGGLT
jgi:hypothetical protein